MACAECERLRTELSTLVVLLRAKCNDEEWEKMAEKFEDLRRAEAALSRPEAEPSVSSQPDTIQDVCLPRVCTCGVDKYDSIGPHGVTCKWAKWRRAQLDKRVAGHITPERKEPKP